jgi:hypothetical protein
MIRFPCPQCRRIAELPDKFAGSETVCTLCQRTLHVPDPTALPVAREKPTGVGLTVTSEAGLMKSLRCRVCKQPTDKPAYVNRQGKPTKTPICSTCLETQVRRQFKRTKIEGRKQRSPGTFQREYDG